MKKIFTTKRLLIREFEPDDWQDVYEMNSCVDVIRLIGDGQVKTIEEEKTGFERILLSYKKGDGLGIWAVTSRKESTFIGAASMTVLEGTDEIQLGYRFKMNCWGQGYATEVAKGLVEYGFGHLRLKRIAATTNLANNASRRVLEKAGLTFEKKGIFYNWEMNYLAIVSSKQALSK